MTLAHGEDGVCRAGQLAGGGAYGFGRNCDGSDESDKRLAKGFALNGCHPLMIPQHPPVSKRNWLCINMIAV